MPTLSLFFGIVIRMYNEKQGKHKMEIHKEDLLANWNLLSKGEQFFKIEPLK
jgi:hypothetical protein